MKPQCRQVLDHMMRFGSIAPMRAQAEYGIMRLASRIDDLRKDGYEIDAETVTTVNRYGKPVHFARYSLRASTPDPIDAVHAEIEDAAIAEHMQGEMFGRRQEAW